jgi:hypothetical protein
MAMSVLQGIRLAYLDGCRRGAGAFRACLEWDLDEDFPPLEQAEDRANKAYLAASAGNLGGALCLASAACQCEQQETGECPTWGPFRKAIELALREECASVTKNDERNCCHA